MRKVQIYGERCSGTNYLQQALITNFDVEITWDYGWKHFFGFNDLSGSDDVLFIGIVRNLPDWVNSFYREKHHLPTRLRNDVNAFLNDEFFSIHDDGSLIETDVNIENNKIYKNIFELRHVKNKFLVETMPLSVKNYKLITYDSLISDFVGVMNQLRLTGLVTKQGIPFPVNIGYYKAERNTPFIKKTNQIPTELILSKANLFYEKLLFTSSSTDSTDRK
jgi:hypothetical protein